MARYIFDWPETLKPPAGGSIRLDSASGSSSPAAVSTQQAPGTTYSSGVVPPEQLWGYGNDGQLLGPDGIGTLYAKAFNVLGQAVGSPVALTGALANDEKPGGGGLGSGTSVSVTEAPLSPERYTQAGDPDSTGKIQRAITAATRVPSGEVFLNGDYTISDSITITGPVAISGAHRTTTRVKQTGTAKHGFVVQRDTLTAGVPFTRGVTIGGFTLEGAGRPTAGTPSTGTGVLATGDATYQGQALDLDLRLTDWDTCVRTNRWDNVKSRVALEYSRLGYHSDGNANSHKLLVSASNCTEAAVRLGDGGGVEIEALDLISCGVMIDMLDQAQALLTGGNFESCTGAEAFIKLANGARLVATPGRFVKNVGNDVPGFLVQNGASLVLLSHPAWSGFTTAKTVRKASTSAIVQGPAPTRSLSVAPEVTVDEGGLDSYGITPFPTRQENSVPTAADALRGMLLWAMIRAATTTGVDRLYAYVRDRSGGTSTYQRRDLTNVMTGTGSPEGAVAAVVGTFYGRLDGGAGTSLYVKESGTGNTGWIAK